MKQADLQVGGDYALPTYEPYDGVPHAARVMVVSIDGGGKATVHVIDPGPRLPRNAWGARPVKQNERRQVATRNIACPWEAWESRAASIRAERDAQREANQARHDEYEQRRADRLAVDSERVLPEQYDEEWTYPDVDAKERAALCGLYIKARGLGPYATNDQLEPLLVDLPVPVLRDILAAMAGWRSGDPGTGTVTSTFRRAAELLEAARIGALNEGGRGAREIPRPGQMLGPSDAAFVGAVCDSVVASGGEITLPPVPPLPAWVSEACRSVAPALGWLRVAIADTSGRLLHSPGCRSVRSRPVLQTEHAPWWKVMLEDRDRLCGVCDGPSIRDLVPLAGFVAAVDVWLARDRSKIERWQQSAFYRLASATATARAQALEPDITLAARVVATLSENPPAESGWVAFATVAATRWNRLEESLKKLPSSQREQARLLARDRLTALESALPPSQRPLPLPKAVHDEVLRERYLHLQELLRDIVPSLDRLLFTLPDRQWRS